MPTLKSLLSLLAVTAFVLASGSAYALTPGKDYRVISPPQPAQGGQKVEVLEFFWYGCPHCHHLQGPLEEWLKNKPADVEYKRVPAAFNEAWLQLARVYYTLEAMGLVDKLHQEVFDAIHGEKRTLDPRALLRDPKPLFDWVATKGVDRQKFVDVYNSFGVKSRTQRILELTRNYDIQGTPSIVVDGRYLTAPSMTLNSNNAIDYERFFKVLEEVIALARKGHQK